MSDKPKMTFAQMHEALEMIADHGKEWSGLPVPVDGERLVVHPKYRFAKVFERNDPPEDYKVINSWHSNRLGCDVAITEEKNGQRMAFKLPDDAIGNMLRTSSLAPVWKLEAERAALDKLAELLPPHKFRSYLLTGLFIETSKRSGVTYLFRKLRPTIALRSTDTGVYFLCALCLHPIGYYEGTFAGSMVPTDEVISHLLLMRADEKMFWRRSNQHSRTQMI